MDWLKTYHEDHKAVLVLLAKFEGNILDLKAGLTTPNIFSEFEEFGDVITNVVIPHFKKEETGVYKQIAELNPEGKEFIQKMLEEHRALFSLFNLYVHAVETKDTEKLIEIGNRLEQVLRHHIVQEEDEVPKFIRQ
ncbi:MAG: hemerythrin domain-containing protein [Eubacteriales bacterium]